MSDPLLPSLTSTYQQQPGMDLVQKVLDAQELALDLLRGAINYGFYFIVAVGLLRHLRVSFIACLGFEELPSINFEGARAFVSTVPFLS